MNRKPRILFIGWMLAGYGGLETRLVWATRVAERAGFVPEVHTGRPVPAGSRIEGELATIQVGSAIGSWENGLSGRLAGFLALLRHLVVRRSWPTEAETSRARHRASKRLVANYWQKKGRKILVAADVVHLIGPPHPYTISAMEEASSLGIPIVYQSVHAVTKSYAQNKWRSGFIGRCNLLNLILISHSGAAQDFKEHFGYTGRTLMISQSAYEIEGELLRLPLPSPERPKPVIIGALCRFDQVKGLDVLIRAFSGLADKHPTVELQIGGSGAEESALKTLAAELGVAERIRFVGFIEDRVKFYGQIDVFVISSREEGGPVTGVEAMASGRAIVSTDVGAMPDRLADGRGILVSVGDVSSLLAALDQLVGEPETLVRMASMARERYVDDYSEYRQSVDLVSAWTELVPSSNNPAG